MEIYRAHWNQKIQQHQRKLQELKNTLLDSASICALILKREFHVQKVFLIGSLSRDGPIHLNTDIDIVVIGLDPYQYIKALVRCYNDLPKDTNLDLLTFESLSEEFQHDVLKSGIEL